MLRKKNKSLTDVEISIIKRLHSDGKNNQEILGIINSKKDTPSLHINPGRISEVYIALYEHQTEISELLINHGAM